MLGEHIVWTAGCDTTRARQHHFHEIPNWPFVDVIRRDAWPGKSSSLYSSERRQDCAQLPARYEHVYTIVSDYAAIISDNCCTLSERKLPLSSNKVNFHHLTMPCFLVHTCTCPQAGTCFSLAVGLATGLHTENEPHLGKMECKTPLKHTSVILISFSSTCSTSASESLNYIHNCWGSACSTDTSTTNWRSHYLFAYSLTWFPSMFWPPRGIFPSLCHVGGKPWWGSSCWLRLLSIASKSCFARGEMYGCLRAHSPELSAFRADVYRCVCECVCVCVCVCVMRGNMCICVSALICAGVLYSIVAHQRCVWWHIQNVLLLNTSTEHTGKVNGHGWRAHLVRI